MNVFIFWDNFFSRFFGGYDILSGLEPNGFLRRHFI
jgi:hypothetical protein